MTGQKVEPLFNIFYKSVGQISEKSKRIYADGLVVWLGVKQSLELTSLRGGMEELFSDRAKLLMGDCLRKQKDKISSNAGALTQARQQISLDFLQSAVYSTFCYIRQKHLWQGYRLLSFDGSTVPLNKSNKELLRQFPGGGDHKKGSRWPLINLSLMVDLLEGTIVSANTGAKYGKNATSEQELSLELLPYVDEKAIVVADRNYGTFRTCYELQNQEIKSLIRLNKTIAKMLNDGVDPHDGLDKFVSWRCSPEMAVKYGYTKDSTITGRLISKNICYNEQENLVSIFTTIESATAGELIDLYKLRWNIEGDLKNLKQQVRLKDIQSEKAASVIVELFCKFIAFNLTRGLVLLAVLNTDINPRRISFVRAWLILRTQLPEYAALKTETQKQQLYEHILSRIRAAVIPIRPGRSYPRHVYLRKPARYSMRSSALKKTKRH